MCNINIIQDIKINMLLILANLTQNMCELICKKDPILLMTVSNPIAAVVYAPN